VKILLFYNKRFLIYVLINNRNPFRRLTLGKFSPQMSIDLSFVC